MAINPGNSALDWVSTNNSGTSPSPTQPNPLRRTTPADIAKKARTAVGEARSMTEDKKFTEDLHSRKTNGRFIESSGNSKPQNQR